MLGKGALGGMRHGRRFGGCERPFGGSAAKVGFEPEVTDAALNTEGREWMKQTSGGHFGVPTGSCSLALPAVLAGMIYAVQFIVALKKRVTQRAVFELWRDLPCPRYRSAPLRPLHRAEGRKKHMAARRAFFHSPASLYPMKRQHVGQDRFC